MNEIIQLIPNIFEEKKINNTLAKIITMIPVETDDLVKNLDVIKNNVIVNHDNVYDLLLNPIHTFNVCLSIAAQAVNNSKNGIDCIVAIPNGGLFLSTIVGQILDVPVIIPHKGENVPSEWIKVKNRHTYSIDPDKVDVESPGHALIMDDRTSVGICTKSIMDLCSKMNLTVECCAYYELEERSMPMFLQNTGLDKEQIISIIKTK